MKKQEKNSSDQNISFKKIAEEIAANPSEWVLFLGHSISSHPSGFRRKKFFDLAKEIEKSENEKNENEKYSIQKTLYQSIENEDYTGLSNVLFGDMWDGASFLEDNHEKQQMRRKEYAESLAKREIINIDNIDKSDNIDNIYVHVGNLLKIFSGIILTTCQDETVEAFLEYEDSIPADDMVCTPYTITTSSTWDWWIRNGHGDIARLFSQVDMQTDQADQTGVHILVKLYGTNSMPHRLLLSEQDFKEFYPAIGDQALDALPQTMLFLKTIFEIKNLLFLGVDFSNDCALPLAGGIKNLLEKDMNTEVKRYAYIDINKENANLDSIIEKYHIQAIHGMSATEINNFHAKARKNPSCTSPDGDGHSELPIENALEQFGRWYTRRPYKKIFLDKQDTFVNGLMEKELKILKEDILGFRTEAGTIGEWSETSIKQLAIAANNMADFYDLKKVFDAAVMDAIKSVEIGSIQFYETVTKNILKSRLSNQSKQLRQILSAYGKGFPLGFLQLLTDDEEKLKEWKRAGICLTNSGMYIKRNDKDHLQKRMSYADNVIQSAGTYPDNIRKRFQSRMEESYHQVFNSYFYPVDDDCKSNKDDDCKSNMEDEYVKNIFISMFRKLRDILEDEREGCQQIHSLLQTETQTIIKKMRDLEDKTLEWKPSLFYHLLIQSHIIPSDCDTEQREAPEKQAEVPEKQAEAPEKQAEVPEKQAEVPEKQAEVPEKQAEVPEKQTEAPEKQTEAPEKQTEAPEKQAETPEKQTEAPEKQIDDLLKQVEALSTSAKVDDTEKILESKLMLNMAKIIIMEQSLGKEGMNDENQEKEISAIENQSKEVEEMIEEQVSLCTKPMPEWLFMLDIQFHFLKCKMYSHICRIIEIKRYKEKKDTYKEQEYILNIIKQTLKAIKDLIQEREDALACSYEELIAEYNHFMGKYYFKKSKYYWENRKFAKEKVLRSYQTEDKCYKDSEEYYKKALEYYDKYPLRFDIQRANVMRNLADLYCQKKKGLDDRESSKSTVDELEENLYNLLIEAYILYRNNSDLHGIADVLQSMGNAETYHTNKTKEYNHRSRFCFHKLAIDIYEYLGDAWNRYVICTISEKNL